jgi:membrane associated rhomboid family serine protease
VIGFVRRHPVTVVLTASLVAVFGYESYQVGWRTLSAGGGLIVPRLAVDWSVFAPAIQRGEWWRFVTAGFVHFNVLHLALNLVGLLFSGALVESRFGRARFVAVYVASLLGGNALAYVTTIDSRAFTGGASGAIMGLFGAIGVFGVRFWSQREQGARAIGPVIATLLNGVLSANVSNAAHIGGLVAGVAVAMTVGFAPGLSDAIRAAENAAEQRSAITDAADLVDIPDAVENDPANRTVLERPFLGKATFAGFGVLFAIAAVIAFPQSVWGGRSFWLSGSSWSTGPSGRRLFSVPGDFDRLAPRCRDSSGGATSIDSFPTALASVSFTPRRTSHVMIGAQALSAS